MRDFIIGDIVRIKTPESVPNVFKIDLSMSPFVGLTGKIDGLEINERTGEVEGYRLNIDNMAHVWSDVMLEHVETPKKMFGIVPEEDTPDKVAMFRDIAEDMADLYARKNHDYGDSFGESWKDFGITGSVIRLGDKYRRLRNLTRDGAKAAVQDESIKDTLMDLACYAVMTLVEMRRGNE